jgi:hypothetical protein
MSKCRSLVRRWRDPALANSISVPRHSVVITGIILDKLAGSRRPGSENIHLAPVASARHAVAGAHTVTMLGPDTGM